MAAPKKIRVIIAFAALYLVWGSTYLGIRFAIESIPPFLMAGMRFLLAGVIMYVIAWSQGTYKSSWANWRTSLIIGACLLLAGNGLSGLAWSAVLLALAFYSDQLCVFLQMAGDILRLECRSCSCPRSSGRQDRFIRVQRNTLPLHS